MDCYGQLKLPMTGGGGQLLFGVIWFGISGLECSAVVPLPATGQVHTDPAEPPGSPFEDKAGSRPPSCNICQP